MYDTSDSKTKSQKLVFVHKAQAEHAPDIVSIQRASWRYAYPKTLIDELLGNLPVSVHQQMWAERVQSSQLETVIVFDEANVQACGFMMFEVQYSSLEVHALYLQPDQIGSGYGRTLLEAAMQAAKQRFCTEIRLWVMEDNQQAIGFYQHLGMQLCGVTQVQKHFGKPYRKCLMSCEITLV